MLPTQFDRYKIQKQLGKGGMATVYKALDPLFEREVALKTLPNQFLDDPQFLGRFKREAKTIANLEHPAIVPVYDYGETDGQPYLVMRYMPGGSVVHLLRNGPISLERSLDVVARIASALDRAHQDGIVHRDLKPDNILLDEEGNAYLSDFGIAKLLSSHQLDFVHLVDKKREQDKLISPTKEKSNAYLASRNYDRIDTIYASI